MTERERMDKGILYDPGDEEILAEQFPYLDELKEFNEVPSGEVEKREEMMKKMFAECGDNCYIQPPFFANWSGHHIYMGKNVYANFNLTVVDDGDVFIGDYVMIGPNVTIVTAAHPIKPDLRRRGIQFNRPVHIENNVWIGGRCNYFTRCYYRRKFCYRSGKHCDKRYSCQCSGCWKSLQGDTGNRRKRQRIFL